MFGFAKSRARRPPLYGRAPVSRKVALLVVTCCALSAQAVDFRGRARLWLGPGFDSNARRDYVSAGRGTQSDLFLFGLGQLDGRLGLGQAVQVTGAYDVAGRKFIFLPSEDTVVQSAQLEVLWAATRLFNFGAQGRARDRRGAGRDYTDLQAAAVIDFLPDRALDLRLTLAAHRFMYWPRFAYSFWGPDGALTARYRFLKRHSLSVFGSFNPRTYDANAVARPEPEGTPVPTSTVRSDTFLGVGASWAYRGPMHLSLSYTYFDQSSNSWGETLRRHRLAATVGVALPLGLTALAAGTLQLSSFPDGVYLAPELTVVEDDENSSSATLKVVRSLGEHVELDLRYAFFVNALPANQFVYVRHVVTLGVAFSY